MFLETVADSNGEREKRKHVAPARDVVYFVGPHAGVGLSSFLSHFQRGLTRLLRCCCGVFVGRSLRKSVSAIFLMPLLEEAIFSMV